MSDRLRSITFNRDAVVVSGPDAVTYLQGQLSQDVAALEVGGSAWSWLLQPAGKVDALVRVTRTGPDALLVDVDSGCGEAVLNRLTRFKLRTKAELEPGPISVLALRGRGAVELAGVLVAATNATTVPPGADTHFEPGAIASGALWSSDEEAADVLLRDVTTLAVPAGWDVAAMDPDQWEAARIAAGVPLMGAELTSRTIPAETGLVPVTASFTKGCYTGQELVARIDSRGGNVARHLRGLRSASALTPGDELTNEEGKVVGTVTSAATHPQLGPVALGYVARSVDPGGAVSAPTGSVTVLALRSDDT